MPDRDCFGPGFGAWRPGGSAAFAAAAFLACSACVSASGEAPRVARPTFFVHVTDLHVKDERTRDEAAAALRQIGELSPPPDFVANTGDNVYHGDRPEEVASYRQAVDGLKPAYHMAPGNHDLGPDGTMPAAMSTAAYHSFALNGVRFVFLDVFGRQPEQPRWFEGQLEDAVRAGQRVVLFAHDALGRRHGADGDRLRAAALGRRDLILGVFAGHWHSNWTFSDGGLRTFVTPPMRMGGIDASLMGMRLVRVGADGRLSSAYVPLGLGRRGSVSSYLVGGGAVEAGGRASRRPSGSELAGRGARTRVVARFMDPAREAFSAALVGGKKALALRKVNRWAFAADLESGALPAGGTVEFRDEAGGLLGGEAFVRPDSRAAPVRPGRSWATFHGDARRTGSTDDAPGPRLRIAWAAETGAIPFAHSPVYRDGRVFAAASAWSTEMRPVVLALDAASGVRRWSGTPPNDVHHALSVTAGAVSGITVDGEFCLFDPADGRVLGVRGPAAPPPALHPTGATAALEDGRHIGGTQARLDVAGRTGSFEVGFSSAPVEDWAATLASPASDGRWAYLGSLWGGGLQRVDLAAGERSVLGRFTENWGASPVLADGLLFYVGDGRLTAFDLRTQTTTWALPGFERVAATPALDEAAGALYAVDGSGSLLKVGARGGEVVWKADFAADSRVAAAPYRSGGRQAISSPAVTARHVWVADLDGNICAVDKASGRVASRFSLGAPTASSPAVSGNALFIGAMDGFIYALTGTD